MVEWKVGDWVVFDLRIGQVKEVSGGGMLSVSDGSFETSGNLSDRCRPLTLKNKSITECFNFYYNELRKIDGENGFNYPDISQYFAQLALDAMDIGDDNGKPFKLAQEFVREARDHKSVIQGVRLFRPKLPRRSA